MEGGEEEAEPAQLLAPKGFCCRLCFPKQPSSSSDHLQGGKNKNKTKRGSRSLKGSIWMLLRVGDGSGTWPCLASAVPIAAGDRQTEYFYVGSGGLQEPPNALCASGLCSECSQALQQEGAGHGFGASKRCVWRAGFGQGSPFGFMPRAGLLNRKTCC